MWMETTLRDNLFLLARIFADAIGCRLSTISKRAINDSGYFARLKDPKNSFTVSTYDRLVKWFFANWPENAVWPENVAQPDSASCDKQ
jgi:hypothetical protein